MTYATRSHRRARASSLSAIVVLTVIGALLLPVGPASAIEIPVVDETAIRAELSTAGNGDPVVLTTTITTDAATPLAIERDVTVDLNGQTLTTGSVQLATDVTLTITDTSADARGTWNAQGGPGQAGFRTTGATIVIDAGTIAATGGALAAGIGGNDEGSGGIATIAGGAITAIGGEQGTGIGGGRRGSGGTTTIASGTTIAIGGSGAAGIGGGLIAAGGSTTITGGTTTAIGGLDAAGIGGGIVGAGGVTTITGGTTTAFGGVGAAGIGGGSEGAGNSTVIRGGDVTAIAGDRSAGIGGAASEPGGLIDIDAGTVRATGGPAVGSRSGGPGLGDGAGANAASAVITIGNSGTTQPAVTASSADESGPGVRGSSLQLRSGSLSGGPLHAAVTVDTDAVVELGGDPGITVLGSLTNNGTITLNADLTLPTGVTMTNNGVIDSSGLTGEGALLNNGSICSEVDDIAASVAEPPTGLTVTGNAYYLPLNDPSVGALVDNRVYAPTFAHACADLPDVSTETEVHVGWTAGINGPFVGPVTPLADVAGITAGVETVLEARLVDGVLTIDPATTNSTAGDTVEVTVFGPVPLSNELSSDLTAQATLSGDITVGEDPGTFVSTTAGDQTVSAAVDLVTGGGNRILTGGFAHTTLASTLNSLDIAASALAVDQGDSITLRVTGSDAFGNPVRIAPDDITVTSSVATDIIDGLRVTFPTASPHVLTVTVGDVSAQVTVEVEATAVIPVDPEDPELADTGARETAQPLGVALLALLLGAALLFGGQVLTRRRALS